MMMWKFVERCEQISDEVHRHYQYLTVALTRTKLVLYHHESSLLSIRTVFSYPINTYQSSFPSDTPTQFGHFRQYWLPAR